ncbi:MAG: hypothetical protein HC854_13205 [Flavobacterium sp.]|nr:hypothetical protein [Flavobacterium sp.]
MKSIYFAIIIFFALGCKPKQNAKMPAYKNEDLKSFIKAYSYILDNPFNPLLAAEKIAQKLIFLTKDYLKYFKTNLLII